MSQIVPYQQKVDLIRTDMKKMRGSLIQALPRGMDVDHFSRLAMTAIQTNPRLLDADRRSLFAAVVQCAQLGLELDNVMGQAYLVPFKGKVQLIPGYKGLAELARRSDKVMSINFGSVHEGDFFDFAEGSAAFVTHKQQMHSPPGPFVCSWATAELRDARIPQVKVCAKWFIDQIRDGSQAKDNGPWVTHFEAMANKTAIKQLSKLLPASVDMRRAVLLDDQAEIGEDQMLPSPDDTLLVGNGEPEQVAEQKK